MIYRRTIARQLPRNITPRVPVAVLSLHTALPAYPPAPVLCLPTSYILLSLQKKKHQFPKFPMRRALSLADLRWRATGPASILIADYSASSSNAQSLTDASSCHKNTYRIRFAHVSRLIFNGKRNGNII